MSDFLSTFTTNFYAASGAPAQPTAPTAADDSAARTTLAAAITAGDPNAIRTAAQTVVAKDLTELAQQIEAWRTSIWHARLMLAAISAVAGSLGIEQIPSAIVDALRAGREQETLTGGHPAAAAILQGYLTALQSSSAATLT